MSRLRSYIFQDCRLGIAIIEDHIQTAITIEITNGHTAGGPGISQGTPRRSTNTLKLAIFQVAKQQRLLRVGCAPLMIVDGWIDVTISDHHVLPTIIVVVDKHRSPTKEWQRYLAQAGHESHISKVSLAVIVIQHV